MKKVIRFAVDLTTPLEIATQKLAFLGVTGSGKTYAATGFAEQLLDNGVQVVVIDPVGSWWSLRLNADGKTPSQYKIPVFGGLHGDVPLESTAGALIANLIVDRNISAIIDVSQFESDAQKSRFAADFADRFFYRKKAAPSAVHLFIEECQEFVPQNPQRDENRMLHVFTRMQKLGRNYGIGSSYITQRPQEVNKKALNMCQTLFVFRTTGSQERSAIEKWIDDKSLERDIAADLPKLPTGHCHVWSPEFLKISNVVKIVAKKTFNGSATPEVGTSAKARHLAPIDLAKIEADMKETVERAKAEDPTELKKQIRELQSQLKKKGVEQSAVKSPKILTKYILDAKQVSRLENAFEGFKKECARHHEKMNEILSSFNGQSKAITDKLKVQPTDSSKVYMFEGFRNNPALGGGHSFNVVGKDVRVIDKSKLIGATNLPPGEAAILRAAIQFPDGLQRNQLTVLTRYKRSSRDAYIARLTQKGLVTSGSNGTVMVTDKGIATMPDAEPLPTGAALREHWLRELPEGERKILEVLIHHYPAGISRETIDEQTLYKRSSRDAYIARMTAKQVIVHEGRGFVKASPNLF